MKKNEIKSVASVIATSAKEVLGEKAAETLNAANKATRATKAAAKTTKAKTSKAVPLAIPAEVAPKKAQDTAAVPVMEVLPTPTKDPLTEAAAKAAALKAELAAKTAALQKTLETLERKQKLNNNRTRFVDTLDHLDEFEKELNEEKDTFESKNSRLSFFTSEYQSKPDFSISCKAVLIEFIHFIRERIKAEVNKIESELIK